MELDEGFEEGVGGHAGGFLLDGEDRIHYLKYGTNPIPPTSRQLITIQPTQLNRLLQRLQQQHQRLYTRTLLYLGPILTHKLPRFAQNHVY